MANVVTPRENDVLGLITQGYSNPQIARELCIDLNTVKTHLNRLFLKFEVDNRTQLAMKAITSSYEVAKQLRRSAF